MKSSGDELRSGTFCVIGCGHQLARDVGAASYAGRLTAEARRVSTDKTPLQRSIEFVVRLVMALTVLMSGAILAPAALEGFTMLRVVRRRLCCRGWCPTGCSSRCGAVYARPRCSSTARSSGDNSITNGE